MLFFSSAFCRPCAATRQVLDAAARLVPQARIREIDVAREADLTEDRGIVATPTVVIDGPDGHELFRATGVPTVNQVLVALAKAG
ncbi:thioredoxin family protein [Herbiconiux sp. SYSU D00978]|uniref:thioredoxin family protein n=1 Tax=Herbiconiux sp. SYSU D00978 TaxID=2812562 RepID=UPI0027DE6D00|nr:thioredoxin family protein [Herbiconiux sp. SYSU D00978]